MKSRIFYTKPSITDLEIGYATDAAANGWGESCYEYIHRFESAFKAHLGVKYAIATSSCTGALHLGLAGLGIGSGDEVILADINWVATAAPIVHLGAKPIFVDILSDSWCLDPASVELAITPRTKAIIAVHLYGNLCDMDVLQAIGEKHGIPIVEDAAEAIGSIYHGKRAGSMGRFGTFSFHGSKTITTGEGGMFVTNDRNLYEYVLTLSNHGRARDQAKQFWPEAIGYKYKMSNIQAAIGLAQTERVEALVARKREIFEMYRSLLEDLPVSINVEPKGTVNGYWMPTIVIDPVKLIQRDVILNDFRKNNIDGRVFFWPLSTLKLMGQVKNHPTSHLIHINAINLPSYHDMTDDQIAAVCSIVKTHFNHL